MKKQLGQYSLINKSAIKNIVAALDLKSGDTVIEIGPGKGVLTLPLAKKCQEIGCKIVGVEKDSELAVSLELLAVRNKLDKELEIIKGDILKILPELTKNQRLKTKSYKLVGNIPYYITGKLLRTLSELENKPELIVLTIQKEVAERITAGPPKMNLLAASVQVWAEPKIINYLKPEDFKPEPKVESAIIKLTTNDQQPTTNELEKYYKLIKIIFKQPRKTILNNLHEGLKKDKEALRKWLKKFNLTGQERPQDLSVDKLWAMRG